MIAIAVVIVGLAVIFAVVQRKKKEPPNYRSLFFIGLCWIPLGVATKNPAFYIMGMIFIIVSLLNKNKWRREKSWSEHTPAEKSLKIALVSIILIMLIVLVIIYYFSRNKTI
jgi:heme/copper-type cytochrome/quinol oxidase subunit 2